MNKGLLKGLIRAFLKPAFSPCVPVKWRRRWLNLASASMSRAPKGIKSEWLKLNAINTLVAYAAVPNANTASQEHILYLHGGGYVSGGVKTHGAFIKHLTAVTKANVWMPDYRLAPEHPYPAALNDAVATYEGLLAHLVRTQPTKNQPSISIMGDSAGGGLALACALALRDIGHAPKALVLFSPWVDLTCSNESYTSKAAADPMLNPEGLRACAAFYCGNQALNHPGCSPLFANLNNLPPLLIQVGSEEVLYDDATTLADKAKLTNTATTLHVYEGMWHVFQLHAAQLQESRDALKQVAAFLQQANKK